MKLVGERSKPTPATPQAENPHAQSKGEKGNRQDGSARQPYGRSPDGAVRQPDGTVRQPDGIVRQPDGTVRQPSNKSEVDAKGPAPDRRGSKTPAKGDAAGGGIPMPDVRIPFSGATNFVANNPDPHALDGASSKAPKRSPVDGAKSDAVKAPRVDSPTKQEAAAKQEDPAKQKAAATQAAAAKQDAPAKSELPAGDRTLPQPAWKTDGVWTVPQAATHSVTLDIAGKALPITRLVGGTSDVSVSNKTIETIKLMPRLEGDAVRNTKWLAEPTGVKDNANRSAKPFSDAKPGRNTSVKPPCRNTGNFPTRLDHQIVENLD